MSQLEGESIGESVGGRKYRRVSWREKVWREKERVSWREKV